MNERSLSRFIRNYILAGLAIIFLFFVLGAGWASKAPLGGAVLASGTIKLASRTATVQHLEGGILQAVHVAEGDVVDVGDLLFEIANVKTTARLEELRNRIRTLAATEARLIAENTGAESIEFSHDSLQETSDDDVALLLSQQRKQFINRQNNAQIKREILRARITQVVQQIQGKRSELKNTQEQIYLNAEELRAMEKLFEKRMVSRSAVHKVRAVTAELRAAEGSLLAEIANAMEKIGETKLQIVNLETDKIEKNSAQLTEIQAQRIGLEKQYREAEDQLARTRITSPVQGTVLELAYGRSGSVIRPGEPLMQIVPLDGQLLIEASVSPYDIDDVHVGQQAQVLFSAFAQRHSQKVDATVQHVSADALVEQKSGNRFFKMDLAVDADSLSQAGLADALYPGMPAEAFIKTQERTLLEYLIEPFRDTLTRAFREG